MGVGVAVDSVMIVVVSWWDEVVESVVDVVEDCRVGAFVHGDSARCVFRGDVAHAVFDPHS